jgi:hypothetical protein
VPKRARRYGKGRSFSLTSLFHSVAAVELEGLAVDGRRGDGKLGKRNGYDNVYGDHGNTLVACCVWWRSLYISVERRVA